MTSTIFGRLHGYLKFYKLDLAIVMLALSCVTISLLALGNSFKQLIDNGLTQNYLHSIDRSILFIVGLIIIFSIASFFRSYFINNVVEKIINQIKKEAYSNIINFTLSSFEELKIGDIISRLTVDIELLSKLIINFLSFFIRNSLMLYGGLILMFWQSPKLALLVIIIIPLLLFPLIQFSKYIKNISKKVLQLQADITANVEESVANIAVIQAFNQQPNTILHFNNQISDYLQHSSKRVKIRSIFFALTMAVILFAITIIIWIGSRDILSGNLTSGQMISFIYYALVAGISSGGIFEFLSEIPSSIAASERVFALIDYDFQSSKNITNNPQATTNKVDHDRFPQQPFIEFDNVSFAYPSRLDSLVFKELSFKITKDKFIGIVGKSGAGKSTIMQLLLKFYDPIKGSINIMGEDISKINTQEVRRLIGYVPQDSKIFSGSIRSNIAFVKPTACEEEILKVADITGVMEFARPLTHGLDTEVGERGVKLSGGQKQKIAISRAILYNPQILLLDEAMSALDNENEQQLLKRLQKAMKDKIIVSIAHRISSVEQADEILVIDNGLLIAHDNHENLLKYCEIYQSFCKEQAVVRPNLDKAAKFL